MERREETMGEEYQGNLFGAGEGTGKALPDYCSDWSEVSRQARNGYRYLALDTETNGLEWWKGKAPFCITAYNGHTYFYANTRGWDWTKRHPIVEQLEQYNRENQIELVFANAKFDMHMLRANFTRVHDVLVYARLIYNEYSSYDLDSVAERLGFTKSKVVSEYIKKNRLYDKVKVGGLGKTKNIPRYDLVPDDILIPYALNDVKITYEVFKKQRPYLDEVKEGAPPLTQVAKLESKLIPALFDMEKRGLQIDIEYCKKAISYGEAEIEKYVKIFKDETKNQYTASAEGLSSILTQCFGIEWGYTKKGNIEIDEDALLAAKNKYPESSKAIDAVLAIRDHYKRTYTYFSAYLKLVDTNGRLHTSIKQSGTKTGRMSTSDPNLQNLSKRGDKEAVYPVRRCIVASPGKVLVAIDYKAFEFCAAVEYSKERKVAEMIASGVDPHNSTASLMGGVDRFVAKCIAEGEPILTNNGIKPIEDVTKLDLVWDGVDFVSHDGVIFQGVRDVFRHQGITATGDHKVFVGETKVTLQECAKRKLQINDGNVWGAACWHIKNKKHLSRKWIFFVELCLHHMWQRLLRSRIKYIVWENKNLQMLKDTSVRSIKKKIYKNTWRQVRIHTAKMLKKISQILEKLFWSWDYVQNDSTRVLQVGISQLHRQTDRNTYFRQNRQQRALRDIKSTVCFLPNKQHEQKKQPLGDVSGKEVFSLPHVAHFEEYVSRKTINKSQKLWKKFSQWYDCRTSYVYKGKKNVYDIINCGPRHRFVVQGKVVSNCVGFGLLYGQGVLKLSNTLGCSEIKAKDYKNEFFDALPNFKHLIWKVTDIAKKRGFIFNKFGRRSYFPDPEKAYKAINSLIQGVTADAVKNAMIQIHSVRPDAMLLQIHDEILFEVEDSQESIDLLLRDVIPIMRDAYPVSDPIYRMNCSVSTGYTWGDMEEYTYHETPESCVHLRTTGPEGGSYPVCREDSKDRREVQESFSQ